MGGKDKLQKERMQREDDLQKMGDNLDFAASEAYNLLRANIAFSLPDKEGCKIIGVTSPAPQEGKSLTSINFAYSLAKNGKKALLIDCDMRRPTLSKKLDIPGTPGLSNVLTGFEGKIINADILTKGLSMITSGDIPPNPSELLGSGRMKNLLDIFSKVFDFIILDLPPVLSVSDAIVVSSNVDGFVIVVKHNHTKRSALADCVHQLTRAKTRILGIVYNGFYRKKGYYRRGGYYGGSYYKYYRNGYYKGYYGGYYGNGYYTSGKNHNQPAENAPDTVAQNTGTISNNDTNQTSV